MKIGIVGLGLIGGSLAKAYSEEGHEVFGFDADDAVLGFAKLSGAVSATLTETAIGLCDAVFLAVFPGDAVEWLKNNAVFVSKGAVVFDCCGVKRFVCDGCFPLAERFGFTFVGGHPMAGSHKAGFKNSRANLFRGASMILVPPVYDNAALFGHIEELLKPVGFGHLTVTTAEKHDEMIAFSSQMAHLVSNAFIKSPAAREHKGFSAGSYKDLTRVARLDAKMWAELFLQNSDKLVDEIDVFVDAVTKYKDALKAADGGELERLLADGSRIKGELDEGEERN